MTQNERLIFLIKYLLSESERYRDIDIPSDITERKNLFRSLVNIRTPKAISDDFIKIQDEYLQGEIAEKGITDADTLLFAENKISLWQGDITTLKCGAIVNAANSAMLGCFVPINVLIMRYTLFRALNFGLNVPKLWKSRVLRSKRARRKSQRLTIFPAIIFCTR